MVQAIGATATAAYGAVPASLTALQSQLQRHQRQLSDCVNCDSADTPRGKADIEAINARIGQVRERIVQAESAQSNGTAQVRTGEAPRATTAPSGPGAYIDVFA